jgi:hypothetical protein
MTITVSGSDNIQSVDGTTTSFGGVAVPAVDGTAPPFGGAAGRVLVPAVDERS